MDRRRGVVTVPTIEYNCYSWPRDHLVPAPDTPSNGLTTWISSAPDEPCETLYVDLGRDIGGVTLDVTVGDHLLDAAQAQALPVRLCRLLRALADGATCPVPAHPLAPAASGWWRAPEGWVCLTKVEDVLRGHPGVLDATVTPGGNAAGRARSRTSSRAPAPLLRSLPATCTATSWTTSVKCPVSWRRAAMSCPRRHPDPAARPAGPAPPPSAREPRGSPRVRP